jgi:hypothetical protein
MVFSLLRHPSVSILPLRSLRIRVVCVIVGSGAVQFTTDASEERSNKTPSEGVFEAGPSFAAVIRASFKRHLGQA